MNLFASLSKVFVTRSLWSWLFEVLPVWLLALQLVVAVASHGDVDGRSSSPLFGPTLRCGDKWMSSANAKIQTLLGKWDIQERHNIDEFMEGLCIPPLPHICECVRVCMCMCMCFAKGERERTRPTRL